MSENYQLFSDESGYCSSDRFGSIAIVSGAKSNCRNLNSELNMVRNRFDKEELKFANVNSHSNTKDAVREFIRLGLLYCNQKKIKIHVIIWDKHDKRHKIVGRDDIENLKRMYYHIIKKATTDWNGIENWEFFPDEMTAIDWYDIIKYIEKTNLDKNKNIELESLFGIMYNFRFPTFQICNELESHKYPILQLADLYAGLTRLSYDKGEEFSKWLSIEKNKNSLFPEDVICDISKKEEHKFQIMNFFYETCSQLKLGVNFSENKHFKTFHSRNGIVIWHYIPQGEYDKAPIKHSIK